MRGSYMKMLQENSKGAEKRDITKGKRRILGFIIYILFITYRINPFSPTYRLFFVLFI